MWIDGTDWSRLLVSHVGHNVFSLTSKTRTAHAVPFNLSSDLQTALHALAIGCDCLVFHCTEGFSKTGTPRLSLDLVRVKGVRDSIHVIGASCIQSLRIHRGSRGQRRGHIFIGAQRLSLIVSLIDSSCYLRRLKLVLHVVRLDGQI